MTDIATDTFTIQVTDIPILARLAGVGTKQLAQAIAKLRVAQIGGLPKLSDFNHLEGSELTVNGFAVKNGIYCENVLQWIRNGYLPIVRRDEKSRRTYISEKVAAYILAVSKFRRSLGIKGSTRMFETGADGKHDITKPILTALHRNVVLPQKSVAAVQQAQPKN